MVQQLMVTAIDDGIEGRLRLTGLSQQAGGNCYQPSHIGTAAGEEEKNAAFECVDLLPPCNFM